MTYYFEAKNGDQNSPWAFEKEREINYLADAIAEKMVKYESTDLYDLVFWFGRSPSLIRHVIENELPSRGYEFRFVALPYMCEPEPWETRNADQHLHLFVEITKSPTREYEV